VFGATLSDQPLMKNLLADLCVDAEAQTLMAMKMAHLYSHAKVAQHRAEEAADGSKAVMEDENMSAESAGDLFRVGVAVTKYFGTKRLPQFMYECMEAHGGNGFVEDLPMAKLYRHAPLNAIWEGSGNVIALDVLRAANKIPLLMDEINLCSGIDSHVDEYISRLENFLHVTFKHYGGGKGVSPELQLRARYIADQLATALQASLMLRYGCPTATNMFIQSRIHPSHRLDGFNPSINYGSVPYNLRDIQHVVSDNMPVYSKQQ
jgi:putative acyl-CoA dehydrogenase